jgi:hypothetical protein
VAKIKDSETYLCGVNLFNHKASLNLHRQTQSKSFRFSFNWYLIMLVIACMALQGCALFKKKCDCPPVGKRRAAIEFVLPLA